MEHIGSHGMDSHEIWYLNIFRKSVTNIQEPLKLDKNNGYFTWRPIYVLDNISLNSFLEWEMFQTKVVEKTKTHNFVNLLASQKSCRLWDIVGKIL
jgi:hypothetical protein